MAANTSPEQKDYKGYQPEDGTPDFLRHRENLSNNDDRDNQPADDSSDPRGEKEADNTRGLADSEQHPGRFPGGYTKHGSRRPSRFSMRNRFSRRQKIIGLAGLTLGGSLIAFLLFFLPFLRLESYLASINQRVFAGASHAVSERTEHLFERYMITHVLTLERCNNNISTACRADYTKMGPAGALFNAWRDARIEQKLIDQYGLKFETRKNPSGEVNRITIRNAKTNKVITLSEGQIKAGKFTGGDRQFGREVNKFLREETRWYQVMQRHSVRKYLARKHGTKFWCFFACKTRDTVELKTADAKTRFKYHFTERVVFPFSGKLGFIMFCIIDGGDTGPGGNCSPEELRKRGIDRDALADEDVDKIVKDFKENPDARLGQVLTQRLLEKIMSKQAARATLATIPAAGQAYFAVVVIDMLDRMDGFVENNGLSKFAADLNARQYLEYYTVMRTANDEMKAGALNVDEVGAIMTEFKGAEKSKVYQTYNTPGQSAAALLGGTALAAEKDEYLCANGKPIPKGELVCPEKKVTRTFKIEDWRNNSIVDGLATALNRYECVTPKLPGVGCPPGFSPRVYIRPVLGGIDKIASTIIGPIVRTVFSGIEKIPYVGDALSYAKGKAEELMAAFFGKVFPLPVQLSDPGREKYDGLEAGGEVAASEFSKGGYAEDGKPYGLGGKKLTTQEQASVLREFAAQLDYDYAHSGFFAKLTDADYPGSLVNRFIAAAPTSLDQLPRQFMAVLSNPLGGFLSFSKPVYAGGSLLNESPFGVSRFGYVVDDPAFTRDPATLTESFCKNAELKWRASMKEDPVTGIDEYYVTNPCLLEEVVVEAASSAFTRDDSLDDGTYTPAPTSTPGSAIVGDIGESSDTVACAIGTKDLGVTVSKYSGDFRKSVPLKIRLCQIGSVAGFGNNKSGVSVSGGAVVNSRVSGAWQALGEKAGRDGVALTSSSSFRLNDSCGGSGDGTACASPGQSPHQLGVAIDFAETHLKGTSTTSCSGRAKDPGNPAWEWLYSNAEAFGFKQYSYESWHWDPLPLANRCGLSQ